MKLDTLTRQGVTILRIRGRLDTTNAKDFEGAVLNNFASESTPLLLNMAHLDYISSAGLRVLILAVKKEADKKSGFALCCIQENVSDVLRITGFLPLFRIFETEEQGLAEFAK
jgi:anti-sigma B factor antagonist